MDLKKGTEIEVEIQYLNISGRGVAKWNDYSIAVERLFPGDKAKISLAKIKKNYAEGDLVELLEPSPLRTEPRSVHAHESGGSPWEVISYENQLKFKQQEVERILGNIEADQAEIRQIIGMEDPWFYRNKMQYSFGYDENMNPTLGLHVAGRKFDVYDLQDCYLAEPWMAKVIEFFRRECFGHGLLPYRFKTGEHELRDLTIRTTKKTKQGMLIISVSSTAYFETIKKIVQQAAEEIEEIQSFWIEQVAIQKGRRTERRLTHIAGPKTITEKLTVMGHELEFEIAPQSFFQPNTLQAETIYNQVAKLADLQGHETVYDLFCGTGTIGLSLSHLCKKVYGIDLIKDAISNANRNAQHNRIANATYVAGDIFKDFEKLNWHKANLVVVDPPRAGLQPNLIEQIAKMDPKKIIYVSCNIKSFSRDLIEFREHGWRVKTVQPVDQFPHTKHLELVSLLEKS